MAVLWLQARHEVEVSAQKQPASVHMVSSYVVPSTQFSVQ